MSESAPEDRGVRIIIDVTRDGSTKIQTQTYMKFLESPPQQIDLSPYLREFKSFPQVDPVLTTYFSESMACVENMQRLAPSILIGCLSELLILRLVKAVGDFLGDLNAVRNFKDKHRHTDRQRDYTRELIRKGIEKLEENSALDANQRNHFRTFNTIITPMFTAIKLRRNECVHPDPEMTLEDLPEKEAVQAHFQAVNPYAKVVLSLIATFKERRGGST